MPVQLLSVQSAVAYGHVGNSAAVFPLQRLGHEVWPVHTVLFSNHTGYGAWRGPMVDPEDVREVVLGMEERGALAQVDLVLSGYQGSPEIADGHARRRRPGQGGEPGRDVRLRPGDGQRRGRAASWTRPSRRCSATGWSRPRT